MSSQQMTTQNPPLPYFYSKSREDYGYSMETHSAAVASKAARGPKGVASCEHPLTISDLVMGPDALDLIPIPTWG